MRTKVISFFLAFLSFVSLANTTYASNEREYVIIPMRLDGTALNFTQSVLYHPNNSKDFLYAYDSNHNLTVVNLDKGVIIDNQPYGRLRFYARGGSAMWTIFDRTFEDGLLWLSKEGKVGAVDENGAILIDFAYDDLVSFTEGIAILKKDGKFGAIDKYGSLVANFAYDRIDPFENGVAPAWINDEQVVIGIDGQIDQRYQGYGFISAFVNGYALVRKEPVIYNEFEFTDAKNGTAAETNSYPVPLGVGISTCYVAGPLKRGYNDDSERQKEEDWLNTKKEEVKNGYSFIDESGNVIISDIEVSAYTTEVSSNSSVNPSILKYVELAIPTFSTDGIARIDKGGKEWFVNCKGEIICEADTSYSFDKKWYTGKNDLGYLLLNAVGNIIFEGADDWQIHPREGYQYIPVSRDGKAGLIDTNGNVIVPLEYANSSYGPKGCYLLFTPKQENNNREMIIFKEDGTMGQPIDFSAQSGVIGEHVIRAVIIRDGKYGVVDEFNNTIVPFEYDNIKVWAPKVGTQLFDISLGGKHGIVDIYNNIIAPIQYDYVSSEAYQKPLIYLIKDKNTGSCDIIDSSGKMVLQGVEGKGGGVICSSKGTAVVWAGTQHYLYKESDGSLTPINVPDSVYGVRPLRGEYYVPYAEFQVEANPNRYFYDENFNLVFCLEGQQVIDAQKNTVCDGDMKRFEQGFLGGNGLVFLKNSGKAIGVFEKPVPQFLSNNYICLKVENPIINANGKIDTVEVDNLFVRPYIKNDRTMIPFRKIFELFGADVIWDENTKTVTAKCRETEIKLTVGSSEMFVNERIVALDAPTEIVSDRTFIPLRAVSEALGAKVDWDSDAEYITITLN